MNDSTANNNNQPTSRADDSSHPDSRSVFFVTGTVEFINFSRAVKNIRIINCLTQETTFKIEILKFIAICA